MSSELKNPEFRARLSNLIGEEKPFAWAAKAGISKGAFDRIWNEGTIPSPDLLIRIQQATGASIDWLLTGEGPMFVRERAASGPAPSNEKVKEYKAQIRAPEGDFVFIPVMQGRISAGGGLVPDTTVEVAIAFQREWIGRKGDPRNMSAIRVQGDSMMPTFQPGDIVLVNHNVKSVTVNGGIYAIAFKDEIMIKRVAVAFPSEELRIMSDNKEYPEFTASQAQVIINGKVIWFGRDLER